MKVVQGISPPLRYLPYCLWPCCLLHLSPGCQGMLGLGVASGGVTSRTQPHPVLKAVGDT